MEIEVKKEIALKVEAVDVFKVFLADGISSKLSAKDSRVMLKFVPPLLAPNETFLEYNMEPKAMGRLDKFEMDSDNKMTWISEMEKHLDNEQKAPQSAL